MTLSISFSKLVRNNLKRNMWASALLLLGFFAVLPLQGMIYMGYLRTPNSGAKTYQEQLERLVKYLGPGNVLVIFAVIFSAVLVAFACYSYLYSRSQVDLYHSIALKREKLFLVQYISGALTFLISFAINMLFLVVVVIARSYGSKEVFTSLLTAFCLHIVFFFLFYHVAVIAVLLTGRMLVGVLAMLVFWLYSLLLNIAVNALCSICFSSYYDTGIRLWEKVLELLSPIVMYFSVTSFFGDNATQTLFIDGSAAASCVFGIVVVLAETVALFLLARFLMKKRPSETAGKSVTFAMIKPVVKVLLVIVGTLLGGWLFCSITSTESLVWMLFGIIFFAVILQAVIESIYTYDFKQIFGHWAQTLLPTAAVVVVTLMMWMDVFGYDTWLPDEEALTSIAVDLSAVDSGVYDYEAEEELLNGKYRLANGQMTNTEAGLAVMQSGIENQNNQDIEENNVETSSAAVACKLKSGKMVYRSYEIPKSQVTELLLDLYAQEEFRKGEYPLLNKNPDDIVVEKISVGDYRDSDFLSGMKSTEKNLLLKTYLEELGTAGEEELQPEYYIGYIEFIGVDNTYDSGYYPLYKSFENTLQMITEAGFEMKPLPEAGEIEKIEITCYQTSDDWDQEGSMSEQTYVYTDPEKIQKIRAASVVDWYTYPTENGYSLSFTLIGEADTEDNIYACSLCSGMVPDVVVNLEADEVIPNN